MKSEWREVRLGDVSKIRRGSSPRPIIDYMSLSGMPWVKIADATENNSRFINKTKEFIKEEGVKNSVIVSKGDLILSNSGTAGLPKFMGITACIHDGWQVFSELNKIEKEYLYYTLINIRSFLLHGANDSTMKNLTLDMVRDFKIILPPLLIQKKIAHILSTLDDKIELNRKMNQTLESMAQTLFKSWFVDFDPVKAKAKCTNDEELESAALELGISKEVLELFPNEFEESELGMIPKGWEVKKLRDISKIVMGLSPKGESYNYENDGLPLLNGASDFNDGILIPIKYTTDSKRKAEKGTLVFCIRATIGLLTYTDRTYSLGRGVAAIEAKNVYRELIYLRLNSQIEQMKLMASGSVFQNLKKEDIEGLNIIIADDKIMKFFHIQHESLFNKIEANTKQIQTLQKTRDTLLPKLLSGELDVSNLDLENED